MSPVTVVTVGDTADSAIDALERGRGPVTVVRRCSELAGLLAACQSGLAQVAVVAAGTGGLTATLVDRLTAVSVSVVAVAETPAEASRLRSIGAWPLTGTVTAGQLTDSVLAVVSARRHHPSASYGFPLAPLPAAPDGDGAGGQAVAAAADGPPGQGRAPGTPAGGHVAGGGPGAGGPDAGPPGENPAREGLAAGRPSAGMGRRRGAAARVAAAVTGRTSRLRSPGGKPGRTPGGKRGGAAAGAPVGTAGPGGGAGSRTLAVWGPIGSPGRTLVAVNLAAELAALGRRVMLVDADSYGASVAASLGLLDESASFAQACRVADQGLLTAGELARISSEVVCSGGTFLLLTGLTRPDRWPELRAAAVERVLQAALSLVDTVVIDCGFCLEADEELSYDTVAPRRNAATLAALGQADTVYAVGSADAIGMPRLIRALAELPEPCAGADIQVVLNKVRKRAAGGSSVKALQDAWQRFGPALPISHSLPWDADVPARALLEGRLLQELAPDSPLRRAVRGICCASVQQSNETAVSSATAEPGHSG